LERRNFLDRKSELRLQNPVARYTPSPPFHFASANFLLPTLAEQLDLRQPLNKLVEPIF
jgi:hypothetical protein